MFLTAKIKLVTEDILRTHSEHLTGGAGQESSSEALSVTEGYRHSTLKPVNYSFHVNTAYFLMNEYSRKEHFTFTQSIWNEKVLFIQEIVGEQKS